MFFIRLLIPVILLTNFIAGCQVKTSSSGLYTAMQTYDRLILKTDADSIALLYTTDGDLGTAAHGRDSIRKFLYQFREFRVLEQVSIIDSIRMKSDTGYVNGTYHQVVIVPTHDTTDLSHIHDTVSVKGIFRSTWVRIPSSGWEIKKMETQSLK